DLARRPDARVRWRRRRDAPALRAVARSTRATSDRRHRGGARASLLRGWALDRVLLRGCQVEEGADRRRGTRHDHRNGRAGGADRGTRWPDRPGNAEVLALAWSGACGTERRVQVAAGNAPAGLVDASLPVGALGREDGPVLEHHGG